MSCEDIGRELAALCYGELELPEMALVVAHLGECEKCRSAFEETRRTLRRLAEEPSATFSESFYSRLEKQIGELERESRPRTRPRGRGQPWWTKGIRVPVPALAFLSLCLISVSALFAWRCGRPQDAMPGAAVEQTSAVPSETSLAAPAGPASPWKLQAHPRAYELVMAMRRSFEAETSSRREKEHRE